MENGSICSKNEKKENTQGGRQRGYQVDVEVFSAHLILSFSNSSTARAIPIKLSSNDESDLPPKIKCRFHGVSTAKKRHPLCLRPSELVTHSLRKYGRNTEHFWKAPELFAERSATCWRRAGKAKDISSFPSRRLKDMEVSCLFYCTEYNVVVVVARDAPLHQSLEPQRGDPRTNSCKVLVHPRNGNR